MNNGGRRRLRIGVFCFLVLVLIFGATAYAEFYAVIVGIADPPGTENGIEFTDDDAIAVREMLLTYPNWQAGNIVLLLDSSANKGAIQAAIAAVAAKANSDDVSLFFFAGHGTWDVDIAPLDEADGYDEYLCAYGSTINDYIRDDELSAWLGALPMERIIVLLDACFSGGQIRGVRSINTGAAPRKGDGFGSDLGKIGREVIQPHDLDDIAKSIVVLTASADDEVAWEFGAPYNHGLFTYHLLNAMRGKADTSENGNGRTSGEECFAYLEPLVIQDSAPQSQHPQLLDHHPGELEFLFEQVAPGPPAPNGHRYGAKAGWYMVSVLRSGGTAADLFGTTAWGWNPATGAYVAAVTIESAKGYWVNIPANKLVIDAGSPVTTTVSISVTTAGWHMISAPWDYPVDEIRVSRDGMMKSWAEAVASGWVRGDIYGYKATDGAYTTPTIMDPWYGYWMRANVSGLTLWLLYVPAPPPPAVAVAPLAVTPVDLPLLPPGGPAASTDRLVFGSFPNPVIDVNTATFFVSGTTAARVETLKVQIFDLAGRLVYAAEETGASILWHTVNNHDEYLANGVYLYKLSALINSEWVISEVRTIVLLR